MTWNGTSFYPLKLYFCILRIFLHWFILHTYAILLLIIILLNTFDETNKDAVRVNLTHLNMTKTFNCIQAWRPKIRQRNMQNQQFLNLQTCRWLKTVYIQEWIGFISETNVTKWCIPSWFWQVIISKQYTYKVLVGPRGSHMRFRSCVWWRCIHNLTI